MKTLRWTLEVGMFALAMTALTSSFANAQGPGYGNYGHGGQGNYAGQGYGGQNYSGHGGYAGQGYGGQGNYGGYGRSNVPVYDPPSVHIDRTFHPTRTHWTPLRGVHTDGHSDNVPRYTPGHYDRGHNGHIDPNPAYHGR